MNKGLIALKQLRQDELSGYYNSLITGYLNPYITGALGPGSGFQFPIASGVDFLNATYPVVFPSVPIMVPQIGCSGSGKPILTTMITSSTTSGCQFVLSDVTSSTGYYINVLFRV
jgi:hypothetical protein